MTIDSRPFCIGHISRECGCWPNETADEACAHGRHWSVLVTPDGNLCPNCKSPIIDEGYPRMARIDAIPVIFPAFPPRSNA